MNTTITLDARHFRVAAKNARELGKSPQRYIESLIAAADLPFDRLLEPIRAGFGRSGATEAQLEDAVIEARKAVRRDSRRVERK